MDIERTKSELKIEPVKKELETGIKSFEVKLENEEKPQVFEQLTSSLEDDHVIDEINWHVCCYCGNIRTLEEMAKTPEREKDLSKWSNILDGTFLKTSTISRMVCQSHLIDEFQDGNNIAKTSIRDRRTCCYCGESKVLADLTTVPHNPNILKQWSQILGKNFHSGALSKKQTFICRSHFDVKWKNYRPHGVLPCVNMDSQVKIEEPDNEEVRLENEDKPEQFNHEKEPNVIDGEENSRKCCYCGVTRESENMVRLPKSNYELTKWSLVLGRAFNNKYPTSTIICRSHFDDEFGDSQLIDIVLINGDIETTLDERAKCCYCGKMRMMRLVTRVPTDQRIFNEWAKILGCKFARYLRTSYFKKSKVGFICRDHFDVEWEGMRPKHLLPVADSLQKWKPSDLPDNAIQPEYRNLDIGNEIEVEKIEMNGNDFDIQHGFFDS